MGELGCRDAARRLHSGGSRQDCRRQLHAHLPRRGRLNRGEIDQTQSRPDQAAEASLAVLDRFMMALNSGDEPLLATLHFPHYRLAGDGIQVWDRPGSYLPRRQLGDRVVSLLWIVTKSGGCWAV